MKLLLLVQQCRYCNSIDTKKTFADTGTLGKKHREKKKQKMGVQYIKKLVLSYVTKIKKIKKEFYSSYNVQILYIIKYRK